MRLLTEQNELEDDVPIEGKSGDKAQIDENDDTLVEPLAVVVAELDAALSSRRPLPVAPRRGQRKYIISR